MHTGSGQLVPPSHCTYILRINKILFLSKKKLEKKGSVGIVVIAETREIQTKREGN